MGEMKRKRRMHEDVKIGIVCRECRERYQKTTSIYCHECIKMFETWNFERPGRSDPVGATDTDANRKANYEQGD